MQGPSGATGSGQAPHSQQSIFSNSHWMSDSIPYPRPMTDNQTSLPNSATPRRYTPPSPNTTDLNDFFSIPGGEWYGVLVQGLGRDITKSEVRMMFVFSSGLEDVRIIKSDPALNRTDVYVRFKNHTFAEEAERLLNDRDMNGSKLTVTVIPRPQASEIAKMAAKLELFSTDYSSQSPSSSDGLATPAATSNASKNEYITTAPGRHVTSPPTNGNVLANALNGPGRLDTGLGSDLFQTGLNGSSNRLNSNGNSQSEQDLLPGLERLTFSEQANSMSGLNNMNNIGGTSSAYENPYNMDTLSMLPNRLGQFHDQQSENDITESMSAFPRPRRQTNPAQAGTGRFGNLPPLSTGGVNNFSGAPMTAPPIGAPQLNSPMTMNSPSTWSSTTNKPYNYGAFPITSHPPANPADQNPPCNTLYVGNLPAQTSEDELKALFCRQRGYKRMCFRTKPQGPMCFVEFEDTHYATKALTELYGRALSNSTKGGVRLSFSKNPLGVRSQNNMGSSSGSTSAPKTSSAIPGTSGAPSHFPTPLRTPPGLPTPTSRQMTSLNTPTTAEPSAPTPPGLFPSSTTPQSLRDQASAYARPGTLGGAGQSSSRLLTAGNGSFYPGSDLRSPVDLRSPAINDLRSSMDFRSSSELRGSGPGTIGCPPGR